MPLVNYQRNLIEIDLADRVISGTILKQKATFMSLLHNQNTTTGESSAKITVKVSLYAAAGTAYGVRLNGNGISDYTVDLLANNNTVVDATDGTILAIRGDESEDDWSALLDAYTQPVMLQGHFFEYLRENAQVQIGAMIRQHIAQADAMGRFQ